MLCGFGSFGGLLCCLGFVFCWRVCCIVLLIVLDVVYIVAFVCILSWFGFYCGLLVCCCFGYLVGV